MTNQQLSFNSCFPLSIQVPFSNPLSENNLGTFFFLALNSIYSLKELPFLHSISFFHDKMLGSLVFLIFTLLAEIEVGFFRGLEREVGDLLVLLSILPPFQA